MPQRLGRLHGLRRVAAGNRARTNCALHHQSVADAADREPLGEGNTDVLFVLRVRMNAGNAPATAAGRSRFRRTPTVAPLGTRRSPTGTLRRAAQRPGTRRRLRAALEKTRCREPGIAADGSSSRQRPTRSRATPAARARSRRRRSANGADSLDARCALPPSAASADSFLAGDTVSSPAKVRSARSLSGIAAAALACGASI